MFKILEVKVSSPSKQLASLSRCNTRHYSFDFEVRHPKFCTGADSAEIYQKMIMGRIISNVTS